MEQTHPRPRGSGVADAPSGGRPVSAFGAPVSRAAIVDRGRAPVSAVAVVAPAGYGKTMLLDQWAHRDGRLAIPLPLSSGDADPAALAASLAAAFARAIGGEGFASLAHRPGAGHTVLGQTATRLQTLIASVGRPIVVLLDDAHVAAADACQDLLEVAFARIPAGSLLVVAGRTRPAFLCRLRLAGRVADVGADDLALTASEIRLVFASVGAPPLGEADALRLRERTEGWAAAATLAAIVAREGGDPLAALGDQRSLAEFLQRSVVGALTGDDQVFLRESAILDPVDASVCDGILGRRDSAARLRGLEERGLLLAPVDEHRAVYRYHPLFRDFLLAELARSQPSREQELHRAAARWYEAQGRAAEAIEHLLVAGDRPHAARLLAERALDAYESGRRSTVVHWLTGLGDAAVASSPPLMAVAGWCSAFEGDARAADRWGDLLAGLGPDAPDVEGLPPLAAARSLLRALLWQHGLTAAMQDAAYAVCAPGAHAWHDHALLLHGWASRLGGDPGRATEAFGEASRLAAVSGHGMTLILAESELARSAVDAGALDDADRHLDRAMGAMGTPGLDGSAAACLLRAVAARRALRRYDSATAARLLTAAMRDRGLCTYAVPVLAVEVRIELCRAQLAVGDTAAAAHLLREIDDVLWLRPGLGALEGAVDDLRDDLRRSTRVLGPSPLTPAELRLLPLLQTHLTIAEIAARLFVSRNTAGTQIGSIYRKLGVSTRSAAVERAAEVGLLG